MKRSCAVPDTAKLYDDRTIGFLVADFDLRPKPENPESISSTFAILRAIRVIRGSSLRLCVSFVLPSASGCWQQF
jgi:hypothetical protein